MAALTSSPARSGSWRTTPAASLGTFCVAEPLTVTVRSTALALAGSASASTTATSAMGERGITATKLPAGCDAHSGVGAATAAQARRANQLDRAQGGVGDDVELDPVALL